MLNRLTAMPLGFFASDSLFPIPYSLLFSSPFPIPSSFALF